MFPLELVKLTALMKLTSGSPEVKIGPICDGSVAIQHSNLSANTSTHRVYLYTW